MRRSPDEAGERSAGRCDMIEGLMTQPTYGWTVRPTTNIFGGPLAAATDREPWQGPPAFRCHYVEIGRTTSRS